MKPSKSSLLVNASILVISLAFLLAFRLIDTDELPNIHVIAHPVMGGFVEKENIEGKLFLKAEANKGYRFLGWEQNGQVISEDTTYTFSPEKETTVTANFQRSIAQVNLATPENLGGQVIGAGDYYLDNEVTVIAEPEYGYIFEGWADDHGIIVSKQKVYSFILDNDITLEARFSLDFGGKFLEIDDGNYLWALVNKDTNLGGYEPTDLVNIKKDMLKYPQWRYELREEAFKHLEEMWENAKEDGIEIYVASAYRSYGTQKITFMGYAKNHGEEEANRFSARAGESEHQLGTAVDFVSHRQGKLAQFEGTPAAIWLEENAHNYGFAMSYPEGMEHITGYVYEPWHYRYIGIEAAQQWKQSGLTLVEYLMTKPQNFNRSELRG